MRSNFFQAIRVMFILPKKHKASLVLLLVFFQLCYFELKAQTISNLHAVEICDNEIDDDGDGLLDCFDPDCCDFCSDFYYQTCYDNKSCSCTFPDSISVFYSNLRLRNYSALVAGDLNHDGKIELVSPMNDGSLSIFDAQANEKFNNSSFVFIHSAIADIDRNDFGEIYTIIRISNTKLGLVCLDHQANVLFQSNFIWDFIGEQEIQIIDLEEDGDPEIFISPHLFRAKDGVYISSIPSNLAKGQHKAEHQIVQTAIADILPSSFCPSCDGLEIICGNTVYSYDPMTSSLLSQVSVASMYNEGTSSIADIDMDGDLDIISSVVNADGTRHIYTWEGENTTILHDKVVNQQSGTQFYGSGVVTVANFDSDRFPEFAVTVTRSFRGECELLILDHDFTLLWKVNLDEVSQSVPVAFDFCKDDIDEIVLSTIDSLFIFDVGKKSVAASIKCGSFTLYDRPLVLDIDGDGSAEIACDCLVNLSSVGKFTVIESSNASWANSRKSVSQKTIVNNAYNDDLSIPKKRQDISKLNYPKNLNSFNQSISLWNKLETNALALQFNSSTCVNDSIELNFTICNKGLLFTGDVDISLYNGSVFDPGSSLIQSRTINLHSLAIGECRSFILKIKASNINGKLYLVINDKGSFPLPFNRTDPKFAVGFAECDLYNNIDSAEVMSSSIFKLNDTLVCDVNLNYVVNGNWKSILWEDGTTTANKTIQISGAYRVCVTDFCDKTLCDTFSVQFIPSKILNLPDSVGFCKFSMASIIAPSGFDTYLWSDGSQSQKLESNKTGIWRLETRDSCGRIYKDSVLFYHYPETVIFKDSLYSLCQGENLNLKINGFSNAIWTRDGKLICSSCDSITVLADVDHNISVIAKNQFQCDQEDSIHIKVFRKYFYSDTIALCSGDSVFIDNRWIKDTTTIRKTLTTVQGCDSVVTTSIRIQNTINSLSLNRICQGDSVFVFGRWFAQAGKFSFSKSNGNGCDSLFQVNIDTLSKSYGNITNTLCKSEKLVINGVEYSEQRPSGIEILNGASQNGCDSIVRINLNFSDPQITYQQNYIVSAGTKIQIKILANFTAKEIAWSANPNLSCTDCLEPDFTAKDSSTLYLTLTDENGCKVNAIINIFVKEETDLYIPNVFSPNGDQLNDLFELFSADKNLKLKSYQIFDRWGELIYSQKEQNLSTYRPWDGVFKNRPLNPGVYVYHIVVEFSGGRIRSYTGDLTLIK